PWPVQEKVTQDKARPTRSDDADRAGHRALRCVLILHDGTLCSHCGTRNCSCSHCYVNISLSKYMLTSLKLVTTKNIATTMESYYDARNPWIRVVARIGAPAPSHGYCARPYLVGRRAHAGTREVTLHDCGCSIGGAHRLGSSRRVPWRGKYLSCDSGEPTR